MKKETCLNGKDGNREIYSKHLQETKLRLMRQTHCQKLLSNTTLAFHPLSELCATGFYTLQAQEVIRINKGWKKGKLENKRRKKGKFRVSIFMLELFSLLSFFNDQTVGKSLASEAFKVGRNMGNKYIGVI